MQLLLITPLHLSFPFIVYRGSSNTSFTSLHSDRNERPLTSSRPQHWNSSLDVFDVEAGEGCSRIFQMPFLSPCASSSLCPSSWMFFGNWLNIASFWYQPTLYFSTINGGRKLSSVLEYVR